MTKRARRIYIDEFKNQMVQLHLNRKPRSEIVKEYDLTERHLISGSNNINLQARSRKMTNVEMN
ncbi:hypothetical protein [Acetobacterium wieringae]|uniref:hypothetical protein n=1 Tax=Acetobacterium wieringae TaxID=52694 RepID=UPI003B8A5C2A